MFRRFALPTSIVSMSLALGLTLNAFTPPIPTIHQESRQERIAREEAERHRAFADSNLNLRTGTYPVINPTNVLPGPWFTPTGR